MDARSFLKFLQNLYLSKLGEIYDAEEAGLAAKVWRNADNWASMEEFAQHLNLPLQRNGRRYTTLDIFDKLINNYAGTVLKILPPEVSEKLTDIPVGVLPTRDMNACALQAPDNGAVIAVDNGLFYVLSHYNEVNSVVAQMAREPNKYDINKYLLDSYKFFVEYIDVGGKMDFPAQQVKLDPVLHSIFLSKTLLQEYFILLHEFAHVFFGHLDNQAVKPGVNPDLPETEVNYFIQTTEQEFEADKQAFEWLLYILKEGSETFVDVRIMRQYSFRNYFTLEIFFLFHLIEKNCNNPFIQKAHPPAPLRYLNIIKFFWNEFDENEAKHMAESYRNFYHIPIISFKNYLPF